MKRFLTSLSLQHEPKASDVITFVKKTFSHEYRTKFYITRCENADFCTRSVRKSAFTHSEWYKNMTRDLSGGFIRHFYICGAQTTRFGLLCRNKLLPTYLPFVTSYLTWQSRNDRTIKKPSTLSDRRSNRPERSENFPCMGDWQNDFYNFFFNCIFCSRIFHVFS